MLRNAPPLRRGALLTRGPGKAGILLVAALREQRKRAAPRPGHEARLASANFTASLGRRFSPNILSLIRSFARHPALLSRKTKMAAPTWRNSMALRQFGAAATVTVALALATPAYAVTEIQWGRGMAGGNNEVVVKLANDFNASQSDYKVVPSYKGGYADTMNAGIAAFRAGNAPAIMQVFEVGTATMMAATGAVKPVYKLMAETGEKFDAKAYLPTITGYYSTSKGEMLSFPFNSSSTVMWVNLDALKKANIAEIPKTWPEVFEDAKKLKAAGYATCGFSNAWATWVNLEQLSAWHNVPLATKANGLDGFDTVLEFNGPLQVKHLETLIEMQKDKTYDYSGRTNAGEGRFTSCECPIFLTSSAFFGNLKSQAKFNFTNAPMPYYPDAKGAPQNSIIGGASLWVMGGRSPEEYKGVAKFLGFLSDTDRQVEVHKTSAYLPITKAAYEKATEEAFYNEQPYPDTPLTHLTHQNP